MLTYLQRVQEGNDNAKDSASMYLKVVFVLIKLVAWPSDLVTMLFFIKISCIK